MFRLVPKSVPLDFNDQDRNELAGWIYMLNTDLGQDTYKELRMKIIETIQPVLAVQQNLSIPFEVFSTRLSMAVIRLSSELHMAHADNNKIRKELTLCAGPGHQTEIERLLQLMDRLDKYPLKFPLTLIHLQKAEGQRFVPVLTQFCKGCPSARCNSHSRKGINEALAYFLSQPKEEHNMDTGVIQAVFNAQPELLHVAQRALTAGERGRIFIENAVGTWQPLTEQLAAQLNGSILELIQNRDTKMFLVVTVSGPIERTQLLAHPWQ